MEMLFADSINDHANYILMFMIQLIQHVNNGILYMDACAHGNSDNRNSTTITATAEHEVYIYKSVILYLDGLIRRYRVLALTVWGPLLPSPIFRTRGGGVMIQTVEAVNSMSLSKGNCISWVVEANCAKPSECHPCANFYYNTPALFTIVMLSFIPFLD